ncbi:hypothetical protein [Aneurinibacillus tyrosinisolvens]|uniref:hypothetical protein n=1 Tax=Aneurinibacillus tyrosinisolvens TaxID=1443435 RepID=UPI00069A16CD|nr:hypothetical protein [Aneurinibacillus tyrosinisolvens]
MKYFFCSFLCFIITVALSACSSLEGISSKSGSYTSLKPDRSPYLSITLTSQKDGKFTTQFFTYNLTSKVITEVGQVPMTAQYPLGVVDRNNNVLYYSERDSTGSDQLVEYDLNLKKKEQLTTNLSAINHMIPVDNKIFMSVSQNVFGKEKVQSSAMDVIHQYTIIFIIFA